MNFYAFSGLFNGLAATALGIFVFLRAPQDPRHRAYGFYCLSISVWSYFYSAWHLTESRDLALLFVRLLMAGAIVIPISYFHHTLTILDLTKRHRLLLRAGYGLCGLFLVADCTPLFVADVHPEMPFKYWPKPGPVFHLYLAWFVAYVTVATYLMGAAYRRARGLQRNQYLYLLTGALIGYAGGATNFPMWYGIPILPNGTILIAVYTMIVAYAMVRYRLFDLTLAMEKVLTLLLLVTFLGAPAYLILEMAQMAHFGEVNSAFSLTLLGLFILLAVGVYTMKAEAQTAVARMLFRRRYDMYETLSEFSRSLVSNLDLQSLTEEIVRTLVNVVGIDTASLYLLDKEKDSFVAYSSHGLESGGAKSLKLGVRHGLPLYLARYREVLVREELEQAPRQTGIEPVLDALRAMESEACIPLVNKERLIGFCTLGPRTSGQMYSEDDLSLLTTLGQNAAIALDNAMLYEDLRRSQALVRRTDRLRSLETIAGGFAHEIRNPLTSIKTFVQLAPERRNDLEFMEHFSKVVSEDVERIERLIQEILDYARYMEPRFTEEELNDVVASCLYFVEVKADSRSITIVKDLAPDLPPVKLDRQQIKQVLLNLFLNAMEAMPDSGGRLTVKTHRLTKAAGDSWVQVEVADTGHGIEPENLEQIFDPFYTTKHESGEREGTGLGLSIVHQIVQEHHGYVEVKSTVGKGTTFFINLPVNPVPGESRKEREQHEKTGVVGR